MIKQNSVKKTSGTHEVPISTASGANSNNFLGAIWGQGIGFLTIFSLAILFASVIAATANVQGAKAAPACYLLKGTGQSVLVSGVANSGVLNFGLPANYQAYNSCASDAGGGNTSLQGWAWNTNLGWVSLYCPAGANQINLGRQCSNAAYTDGYGVTVDVNGVLGGYAWSDNAGWISFDNGAFSKVRVDVNPNSKCVGKVYGYTPPNVACNPNGGNVDQGHQFTFAWSDSVGWLDFSGLTFPVGKPLSASLTVTAAVFNKGDNIDYAAFSNAVDLTSITKTKAPVANGQAGYTLVVKVTNDQGQTVVVPDGSMKILNVWNDTVKKIQTYDGSPQNLGEDQCLAGLAVTKPCVYNSMQKQFANPYPGIYQANITSVAPTSNMNGLDTQNNGIVDFPYESFVFGPPITKQPLQSNDLVLKQILVTISDPNTPGKCIYPDVNCSTVPVNASDYTFKFKPSTEMTKLESPDKDKIVYSNNVQQFGATITDNSGGTDKGIVNLYSGIDATGQVVPPETDFRFDNDNAPQMSDGVIDGKDSAVWNDVGLFLNPDTQPFFSAGMLNPVGPLSGLYIYSVVSEQGAQVQYYSNKLTRSVDLWGNGKYIIPPVAVFRGNVYSGSLSSGTASSQALRSIGDPSTKKFKDSVVKNVYKIIGGITTPPFGNVNLSSGSTGINVNGSAVKLMNDNVYYAKGNVHISGNPFSWTGEKTIIVIGGSVFIDGDLKPQSTSSRLGIIVLKDQAASVADRAKQGNIYINKNVKQIYANMVADGAVFPYDAAAGVSENGEPNFASVDAKRLALNKQQLFMQGNIVSMNTIGGAVLNNGKYVLGNGKILAQGDQNAQLRAELYDLNYLRQFTGYLNVDQNGMAKSDHNLALVDATTLLSLSKIINLQDGTPKTNYALSYGYLYDPVLALPGIYFHAPTLAAKDLAATYIYFDPPTSTLPGFGVNGASFFQNLAQ
ncbi:MAG: hypothetical protein WC843_05285 [Candidatus Gracilibacteria bacterium]|jgi:hypothetical protein